MSGLCGRNGKREYGVRLDSLAAFILLSKKDEEKNCASKETLWREIPRACRHQPELEATSANQ